MQTEDVVVVKPEVASAETQTPVTDYRDADVQTTVLPATSMTTATETQTVDLETETTEGDFDNSDTDAEGELPQKPVDPRLSKLSVMSNSSQGSESGKKKKEKKKRREVTNINISDPDSMLLLCNVCNQHIKISELEEHSKGCKLQHHRPAQPSWEVVDSDPNGKKGAKEGLSSFSNL